MYVGVCQTNVVIFVVVAVVVVAGWANCLARAANFVLLPLLLGSQQFLSCMHASLIVVGGPDWPSSHLAWPVAIIAVAVRRVTRAEQSC